MAKDNTWDSLTNRKKNNVYKAINTARSKSTTENNLYADNGGAASAKAFKAGNNTHNNTRVAKPNSSTDNTTLRSAIMDARSRTGYNPYADQASIAQQQERAAQRTRERALQQLQNTLNNDLTNRAGQIASGSPVSPMTTFPNRNMQAAFDQYKGASLKATLDNIVRQNEQNRLLNPTFKKRQKTKTTTGPNISDEEVLRQLALQTPSSISNTKNRPERKQPERKQPELNISNEEFLRQAANATPSTMRSVSAEEMADMVNSSPKRRNDIRDAFRTPLSPNNTYSFGDAIHPTLTGSGGQRDENGRAITSAALKLESWYDNTDLRQRQEAVIAAQNDPENPMNKARDYLERTEKYSLDPELDEAADSIRKRRLDAEVYSKMNSRERQVYNYIYATAGKDRAEEYKNGILDMLNARVGEDIYKNDLKGQNTLDKTVTSYAESLSSGIQDLANSGNMLLGIENRTALNPSEYATQLMRSDDDNTALQKALYDLAASTGNMTPGLVLSAVGAPPVIGSAVFGMSQAGNAYEEALRNGNTVSQASLYAEQQMIDEVATNYLLGGVNAFGGGLVQRVIGEGPAGQAISRAIDNVAKTDAGKRLLKSAVRFLGDAAGEAQQEYLQFYTDNFTKALIGIKNENGEVEQFNTNPLDPEALYSAALGALNAMLLNAPGTANRVITGSNADVSNAADLAKDLSSMTPDDFQSFDAYEQAQEVKAVAEEIAAKQDMGVEITTADKIAFNEAMSDYIAVANEADVDELETAEEATQREPIQEEEVPLSYEERIRQFAEKEADKKALKAFEETESVRLPENVRDHMVDAYDGVKNKHNMSAYMQAYKRAYVGGYNDVDLEATQRSPLVRTYLTNDQILQAYKDGAMTANVDKGVFLKNGVAPRQGDLTYASDSATTDQKRIAKWAGNKTGLQVEIREDIEGNAEIDIKHGVLRINPNTKNFNQTIAHELTHLIRAYDNEGYKNYQKLVVDALMNSTGQSYDKLYAKYESRYASTGTTPNVDDVIEEMVADGAGQFLNDEEFINRVVKADRSLAEKVVDFFSGIVDAMRRTMSQEGLSNVSQALRENYETYSKALDTWSNALVNASENYKSGMVAESNGARFELKRTSTGERYWQVETGQDIFKNISKTSDLKKAAYDWILHGEKGEQVKEIINGEELVFTRIGANEYVYGDQSKNISPDSFRKKMRIVPSVLSLIENANVQWHSKDMKQHKIATEGWENYRGKVLLDGTMFTYIVRVAQGYKGNQFYDINLEVDNEVPGAELVSSESDLSTSNEKIPLESGTVNRNRLKELGIIISEDTGTYKGEDLVSKDFNRLSLDTYDSVGRETLKNQLQKEVSEKRLSKKNAKKIQDQMEWAYNMVKEYSDSGKYPMFSTWQTAQYKLKEDGTPVFSVVVPNGEYELNLDFTTVCKKRDTLDQVLTALARNGDLNFKKLNQKQLARINEIIKANGFEIACSTCFVDSKRYNISNWAHSLTDGTKSRNGYNQAIASMLNDKVGASYFNYVTYATAYNGKPTFTAGQKLLGDLSNEELLELNPHAFDYINERMSKLKPNSYEYRMLNAIKENQSLRHFLNANDFISSMGQDIIQEQNPALNSLLQSLGGSSRPKPSHGRVAYYSEILNNNAFTPEAAYHVGGVRVQSFSDYMANMVFDYMQMVGDMAAKQLPSHAYTKEPMFAKLFGLTGMKINLSIMPRAVDWVSILHLEGMNRPQQAVRISDMKKTLTKKQIKQLKDYAGLQMEMDEEGNFIPVRDSNGNYIPIVDDETFPMEDALAIRSADGYKQNCGTIWIGTSDEQIRTLLRMEEADMVIPYHASSLNPVVKEMRNIEFMHDYTNQQRTRQKVGDRWKAIPAKSEFDFYESLLRTKDGRTTANEYLAWCDEHGYRPKFDQFRKEDNYYKLLEDFRLYDGDTFVMQGAVTANYPGADAAFGSFETLMQQSLEEANNTAQSLGKKLPAIVDQIRSEMGITNTAELRHQLDLDYEGRPMYQLDVDDNSTGFEADSVFNDNQDIQAAANTLGRIISDIDEMPSKKAINDLAMKLRKDTGTNIDLEKIKQNLDSIYSYLAFNRSVDGADISHIAADLAGEMIQDSKAKTNPLDKELYTEYRNFMRSYTFHLPAGFEGELAQLGGVGALRKEFFGALNITNEKGSSIDEIWDELCDQYPEYFSRDIVNPAEQLEQLIDVTRSLKASPEIESMTDEDFDVYRYSVGQDILKAFVDGGKNAAMRERYEKQLEKGLQKAKTKAKEQKEKAKIKKLDREARSNLLKKAQRLARMKGGPEFEQAKADLIGNLDLLAKGIRSDTEKKLLALKAQADQLAATDENYKSLYYDNAKEVFERLNKKHINDMTGEEVSELTDKIVELIYQQQATKRMLNQNMAHMVATVGRRAISQQTYAKGINGRNAIGSTFGRYALNMLNPTRALQRIDGYQQGGVFTDLGKALNDGQTKQNMFIMNASKKFNKFLGEHPDLVKTWYKQDIDTGLKDRGGNPVYITKGMRISLYLHNMNKQNQTHIAQAGIEIPDAEMIRKGKLEEAYRYSTRVPLQPTDIKRITDGMTADEKAFAQLAHDFLNIDTKNAINETSLDLTGTMKATVDNYFPIRVDKNFTRGDITGLITDGTIEGMGMLKERQKGASKPILLEDVAQVLQRQIDNTALYYGLAIPVRDFNKVMTFTEVGGQESVADSVYKTWGKAGSQYINDLLNHIQGGTPSNNGPGESIFNKLKSTYAGTVLNWNLGVAIKQSASAPFAAVVLDTKSIAKAFATRAFSKADYDYMDSITPWSYMRRQGMSGTEMGEVYKQKNPIEANQNWQKFKQATNWIQNVDVWTTDRLFFATEYYVQDHYPDLKVRSDEYNKKVAEVYNDMLQRTQPSYDVMQRNAFLRSGNMVAKVAGMFKTQTFNMGGEVIDAWSKMVAADRMLKDNRISEAQAKKAKAQFGKTVTATAMSQLMLTVLGIIANAVMHNMKNYRDDKGEVTKESLVSRGAYDFLTSFAGMTMFGSEAQSALLAYFTDAKWYDLELPGLSTINNLISSSVDMTDAFKKAMEKNWDSDSADAFRKKTITFVMNAAIMKRIPADNLYKLGNTFYLHYQDWKNGEFGSFDAGEGLFGLKDSSVTKEQYANRALDAAMKGDYEKASKALEGTTKNELKKVLGVPVSDKMYGSFHEHPEDMVKYVQYTAEDADPKLSDVEDRGFSSFEKLRESIGDPLRGGNWHHIVEQEQGPGEGNLDTFKADQINNVNNIISIPSGAKDVHQDITKYYNSVQDFTGGKTVRQWLAGKSFEEQWEFGINKLREYGDVVPTEKGWAFVPNEEKIEAKIPLSEGTGESESAASKLKAEMSGENVKGDDRYVYLINEVKAGNLTGEEVKEWAETTLAKNKDFKAWKDAGYASYDYVKYKADLEAFDKLEDKKRKQAVETYVSKISDKKKRLKVWTIILGRKESTCP